MLKIIAHLMLGSTFVLSSSTVLSADLTFELSCGQHANYVKISSAIVDFLKRRDFDAVDLIKVRADFGVKSVFEQDIRAVRNDQIVLILKIGVAQRVQVALYSRPPTKHDERLESDLLNYFHDQVDCLISNENRHNNSASSEGTFDRELAGTRNLLREARDISR